MAPVLACFGQLRRLGTNPDNGQAKVIATEELKKERNRNMKSKNKNKVGKSAKTRLSDLTPSKDARGGRLPEAPYPDGGPSYSQSAVSAPRRKKFTTV